MIAMEEKGQLGMWPVSCEIPVMWGDLDALNHVNHTVYLKWMETARMNYFEICGLSELLRDKGIGPILAGLKIDYLAPVLFPDTVTVRTTVSRIGNSSFDMEYKVSSNSLGGKEVARATVFGVLFDYKNLQKFTIPIGIRDRIVEIESPNLD